MNETFSNSMFPCRSFGLVPSVERESMDGSR
jgi:hypothetical protein